VVIGLAILPGNEWPKVGVGIGLQRKGKILGVQLHVWTLRA